jgi:hypothetical protein
VSGDVQPQLVRRATSTERALYLARVEDVEHWPDHLDAPKPHFVVFLAMDATALDASRILELGKTLLAQGMVYLCAWGPDCERVHDLFDQAEVERGTSTDDAFLMTTWHDDESLDEALGFASSATVPSEAYIATCGALVAIVVGNSEWADHVEARLSDPERLNDEVLANELDTS